MMMDATVDPFGDEPEMTEAEIHASLFARSPIGRTGTLPQVCRACAGAGWIYGDSRGDVFTEPPKEDCPLCGPDQREDER